MEPPRTTEPTGSAYAAPEAPAPAAPKASVWEDFIDIFYAPSAVLRRRADGEIWVPILVVAVAFALISFAIAPALGPVMDVEFQRQAQATLAKNPQLTMEQMQKGRQIGEMVQRFGTIVVIPISIFIVGVMTWLVGKLADSKETLRQATLVAGYAYMPRVLALVLTGAYALLVDLSGNKGLASLSFGPARFVDPTAISPALLQILLRLDVFIIWETVILAIGVAVLGKTSRGAAIMAGVLFWVVGSLPQFLPALAR